MGKKDVYIIAEVGVNHNGSLERAKEMVSVAAKAGVNAVKFQMFKTENLMTQGAPKAQYQLTTTNKDETQFDMTKKLELGAVEHKILMQACKENHVDFLSTPFDSDSLHALIDACDVPVIKIPSGEINNAPFLLEIARTKKKIILSTGMSTLGETELALGILAYGYMNDTEPNDIYDFSKAYSTLKGQEYLKEKVQLLHCTTEYPTPYNAVNLKCLDTLKSAFHLPVGYSDHTKGINISLAAVARGAMLIERHFTLDRNLPGPDQKASLEPDELAELVKGTREIQEALGDGVKIPSEAEKRNIVIARKSLVASKAIFAGETFTSDNLTAKRPGSGLTPLMYWEFIGKRAKRDYKKDEMIEI